ncbi:MAG: carbohydrate binding family 9 domain-containing protein [Bacteroidetes bacterium]|nr:carbohydrate binding family 9 domain-containing protein [Bacteroidota bacterium]
MKIKFIILFIIILNNVTLNATNSVKPRKVDEKITIDGVLDEPIWSKLTGFTDFTSYLPDFGKKLNDSTIAYIAYDAENIYCAFICHESEPEKIIATMSARDKIVNDDWVCIGLNSKNDLQGMMSFVVNPRGIQYDSFSSTTSEDIGVDLVWYSAGKLNENGYTVEIQIPFKSLRYSEKSPVTMGFLLERRSSKISTHVTYPSFDPQQGGAFLNQLAKIQFPDIKSYKLFEALPTLTYSFHQSRSSEGVLKNDLNQLSPGVNLKYGLTSSLILDAAINPDFSQIEADAGKVDINLRSQLFFQEKRPFFLEGNDQFLVASTSTSVVDPLHYMIYTRTIANPIAGLKLSGSINKKNTLAVLYAIDELGETLEESKTFAQVPILRYKFNYQGENFLGLLYSGRLDKDINNHAYGIDGKTKIGKSSFLEYNAYNTHTTSNEVSNNTNKNQSGHTFGFTYINLKRNLDFFLTQRDIAKDFNVASGYYNRTGVSQVSALIRPKVYFDSSFMKRIDFEALASATYDKFYNLWETFNHASVQFYLGNSTVFKIKYSLSNEVYLGQTFNTSGYHALLSSRIGTWLSAGILYRRTHAIYYSSDPYGGVSNRLTSNIALTPVPKLSITLSHILADFKNENDNSPLYNYQIGRVQITYQINKYLFLRAIEEYNSYRKTLLSDYLVSFTYIPGTVFFMGYGNIFRQEEPTEPFFSSRINPVEQQRGFFMKISYLYRR